MEMKTVCLVESWTKENEQDDCAPKNEQQREEIKQMQAAWNEDSRQKFMPLEI